MKPTGLFNACFSPHTGTGEQQKTRRHKPLTPEVMSREKELKTAPVLSLLLSIGSVRRNRLPKKERVTQFIKNRVNVRTVAKVTQRIYGISIQAAARFILKK